MTVEKKIYKKHERYIELVKYTWCAIFNNNNSTSAPLDINSYNLVVELDAKDFLQESGELTQSGLLALDTMRGVLRHCSDQERLLFDTILQPLNKGRRTFIVQHKDFSLNKVMVSVQYLFNDVQFLQLLNDWIYKDLKDVKSLIDEAKSCSVSRTLIINEKQIGAFNYNKWNISGLKVFFLYLKDLSFGNVVEGNLSEAKLYLKRYLLAISSETNTEHDKHKSIPKLVESS